ncbi:hypothetical protein AgCh_003676 [Apium graveolens]
MLTWHKMGPLADVALQALHLLSGVVVELKVPSKYHFLRYNRTLAKILVEYSLAVSNPGDPLLEIDETSLPHTSKPQKFAIQSISKKLILFVGKGDCSNILCHFGRVVGCKVGYNSYGSFSDLFCKFGWHPPFMLMVWLLHDRLSLLVLLLRRIIKRQLLLHLEYYRWHLYLPWDCLFP